MEYPIILHRSVFLRMLENISKEKNAELDKNALIQLCLIDRKDFRPSCLKSVNWCTGKDLESLEIIKSLPLGQISFFIHKNNSLEKFKNESEVDFPYFISPFSGMQDDYQEFINLFSNTENQILVFLVEYKCEELKLSKSNNIDYISRDLLLNFTGQKEKIFSHAKEKKQINLDNQLKELLLSHDNNLKLYNDLKMEHEKTLVDLEYSNRKLQEKWKVNSIVNNPEETQEAPKLLQTSVIEYTQMHSGTQNEKNY